MDTATIKIEVYLHGKVYSRAWWTNYWPSNSGIDRRIVEWVSECWDDAKARYDAEARRREELERDERQELARLKAKYEASS